MLAPLTIVLMSVADVLHASWHALIKSGSNRIRRHGIARWGGIGLSHALRGILRPQRGWLSASLWSCMSDTTSPPARACAGAGLVGAFPLARGLVPIFATVIAYALLSERPATMQVVGISHGVHRPPWASPMLRFVVELIAVSSRQAAPRARKERVSIGRVAAATVIMAGLVIVALAR
jgi:hypothetical protein